jgi:hypothetical protein
MEAASVGGPLSLLMSANDPKRTFAADPSLSFNTKLDGIERWSILYRLRFVSVSLALPMSAFGPKRTFQSFGSMHAYIRQNQLM